MYQYVQSLAQMGVSVSAPTLATAHKAGLEFTANKPNVLESQQAKELVVVMVNAAALIHAAVMWVGRVSIAASLFAKAKQKISAEDVDHALDLTLAPVCLVGLEVNATYQLATASPTQPVLARVTGRVSVRIDVNVR